jgi:hypothetical protein
MLKISKQMRELFGVLLKDFPRYQLALLAGRHHYLRLINRNERLASSPNGYGYNCLWPYTSKLHAPLVLPFLGQQILRAYLKNSSFVRTSNRTRCKNIAISVLIGHRGLERLPLLLATLSTFASQVDVELECIVIEQDYQPQIKNFLPPWVDYIFQSTSHELLTYNRSAAFNRGALSARGHILLFHDNDMLAPTTYCRDIVALINAGYDAVNLKRYVFYLNQIDSKYIISSDYKLQHVVPDYIIQNLEAGGSVALSKSSFLSIGGMDEEFVGWGGEDIEFWRRCTTLNRWTWGYHCLVHLWHSSQPLKHQQNNPNIDRVNLLEKESLSDRISNLKLKNWGTRSD